MDTRRDRSLLALTFIAPWTALVRRQGALGERLMEVALSSMLWVMSLGLAVLTALLVFALADGVGRPAERVEGVVVSRTWRPATDTVAVTPVVMANGQVGTALTPDREPERYEVCFQIGDRQACAPVRPTRFEALRRGDRVTLLVSHGRVSGRLRIRQVVEPDA